MNDRYYKKLKSTLCYAEIDKIMADFAATKNIYSQVLYHRQQAVEKYLICVYYLNECETTHGKTHSLKTIMYNLYSNVLDEDLDPNSSEYKAVAFFSPYNSITRYAVDEDDINYRLFSTRVNYTHSIASETHITLIRDWIIKILLDHPVGFEESDHIPAELIITPDIGLVAEEE